MDTGRCQDTSDPGHFGPKTFRHHQTGAEVSSVVPKCLSDTSALVPKCPDSSALVPKCFGTSAEVSYGHFGISAEMSWVRSVLGPKCLDTHWTVAYTRLD